MECARRICSVFELSVAGHGAFQNLGIGLQDCCGSVIDRSEKTRLHDVFGVRRIRCAFELLDGGVASAKKARLITRF